MKANGKAEVYLHVLLTLAPDERQQLVSRLGRFIRQASHLPPAPYLLTWRLGEPQSRSGCFGKTTEISCPCQISNPDSWVVQLIG